MTPEEKQLLLKDLSSRLSYGVNLHIEFYDLQGDGKLASRDIKLTPSNIAYCFDNSHWVSVKPYLRPMSSMTEEEFKEYHSMLIDVDNSGLMNQRLITKIVDWLDERMFDHRNLVPKGLALEAPKDMYNL